MATCTNPMDSIARSVGAFETIPGYKSRNQEFFTWLVGKAQSNASLDPSSSKSANNLTLREYMDCAKKISAQAKRGVYIGDNIFTLLEDVIALRASTAQWYNQRTNQSDPIMKQRNERHMYTIAALREIRRILRNAVAPSSSNASKANAAADEAEANSAGFTMANVFAKLDLGSQSSDSEDDETTGPFKTTPTEAREKSLTHEEAAALKSLESSQKRDNDFEVIFCLARECYDVKKAIRAHWQRYQAGEITIETVTAVTNTASHLLTSRAAGVLSEEYDYAVDVEKFIYDYLGLDNKGSGTMDAYAEDLAGVTVIEFFAFDNFKLMREFSSREEWDSPVDKRMSQLMRYYMATIRNPSIRDEYWKCFHHDQPIMAVRRELWPSLETGYWHVIVGSLWKVIVSSVSESGLSMMRNELKTCSDNFTRHFNAIKGHWSEKDRKDKVLVTILTDKLAPMMKVKLAWVDTDKVHKSLVVAEGKSYANDQQLFTKLKAIDEDPFLIANMHFVLRDTIISIGNAMAFIFSLRELLHVYNAAKAMAFLGREEYWTDMETLLDLQGDERLLLAKRHVLSESHLSKFLMVCDRWDRNMKTTGFLFSAINFDDLNDNSWSPRRIGAIVGNVCSSHEWPTLSTAQIIDRIATKAEKEKATRFDYVSFSIRCRTLMLKMVRAINVHRLNNMNGRDWLEGQLIYHMMASILFQAEDGNAVPMRKAVELMREVISTQGSVETDAMAMV